VKDDRILSTEPLTRREVLAVLAATRTMLELHRCGALSGAPWSEWQEVIQDLGSALKKLERGIVLEEAQR
jgi:hypothetical protein